MTEHIFNPSRPALGERLKQPGISQIEHVPCFKYADYDYVYDRCDNDYVRHVLDNIPIYGEHKRVLIDVKVHDLKRGEVPCVPGWHLDGSINPQNLPKRPETFTLFVTGLCARTEFIDQSLKINVEDSWNFATMNRKCARMIPESVDVWTLPSCQFATYGDHYFHRGPVARRDERRLLVRTTETDIIRPKNSIYTPHTHVK
jgi:hypothetical protein